MERWFAFDPFDPTKFCRLPVELEDFLVFGVMVAGKPARSTINKQARLYEQLVERYRDLALYNNMSHLIAKGIDHGWRAMLKLFFNLREHFQVDQSLHIARTGKYETMLHFFQDFVRRDLDLERCSLNDLTRLYGVGPKTARFFLLHSRVNQRLAVLDRHVMTWLAEVVDGPVPRGTPSTLSSYAYWEQVWLEKTDEMFPGIPKCRIDYEIWAASQGDRDEWTTNQDTKFAPAVVVA